MVAFKYSKNFLWIRGKQLSSLTFVFFFGVHISFMVLTVWTLCIDKEKRKPYAYFTEVSVYVLHDVFKRELINEEGFFRRKRLSYHLTFLISISTFYFRGLSPGAIRKASITCLLAFVRTLQNLILATLPFSWAKGLLLASQEKFPSEPKLRHLGELGMNRHWLDM